MALQAENITGLLRTTLSHYKRINFTNIAYDLQEYTILPMLQHKVKSAIEMGDVSQVTAGTSITWNILTDDSDTAEMVGMYDTVSPSVTDHQVQASINWKHARVHRSYDEREIAMNGTPEKLVDLMTSRRVEAQTAFAKLMETQGWGIPSSANDDTSLDGIRYWVYSQYETSVGTPTDPHAAANNGDFLDERATNFTAGPAGVDPVTYPQWGNWYHQYTNVTDDDAVDKLRHAMNRTMFMSPVEFPELKVGPPRRIIYTTETNLRTMERLAKAQNDQNGSDLASRDGQVTVRRIPVRWVPAFDTGSAAHIGKLGGATQRNPFYGIDWGQLCPVILKGFNMREVIRQSGTQPLVNLHVMYLTMNIKCYDRRRQFLLTT